RQGVVIGDAIARRAAVGRERGDARYHRRCGINGDAERTRGGAGVAGHIGGGRGQAVGAVGERRGGEAPGPCSVGGGGSQQRDPVIDLDGGIGFGAAGERQGIVIGDAIARRAAVGGERGNRGNDRRCGIDGDAERTRGRAGIAGRIGGGCRQAVGAVGKRCRGEAPGPCSVGGGGSQQRDPVIDLDGGIGFGAAGECQGVVIGDAVANRAAVGRVRDNRRG